MAKYGIIPSKEGCYMKNKFIFKKLVLLIIVVMFMVGVIGCSNSGESNSGSITNQENQDTKNEKNAKNRPLVTIEEIPYEITMLEPDSIGTRYMEATYTNNSEYPITGINFTVLLKDKNETTYLTNHDTVLPGETSPKFDSFAPDSGKHEDIEILNVEIQAEKDDETIWIEYDAKLKKYKK